MYLLSFRLSIRVIFQHIFVLFPYIFQSIWNIHNRRCWIFCNVTIFECASLYFVWHLKWLSFPSKLLTNIWADGDDAKASIHLGESFSNVWYSTVQTEKKCNRPYPRSTRSCNHSKRLERWSFYSFFFEPRCSNFPFCIKLVLTYVEKLCNSFAVFFLCHDCIRWPANIGYLIFPLLWLNFMFGLCVLNDRLLRRECGNQWHSL